jgi:hypothetical protein
MTRLTPQAMAQTRRWVMLLATDARAPAWSPLVRYDTPQPLRDAAQWLVDEGHAPGLKHELVCVLLAMVVVEAMSGMERELGGTFIPKDAA